MEKKEPMHFSVITPTHNRCEYLKEAVDSVKASVKVPINMTIEHLICENGSTDGTKDWLERSAEMDPNAVRFWVQPEKMLPGPARNCIIRYAPDDGWLVPLDDDDVMLQRNVYHFADMIQQNPKKEWFVSEFLRMDQERRYMFNDDYYAWRFDTPLDMLRAIFKGETFIQGNVCYSVKLFKEVGGYDETLKMAEDLDIYVRFLLAGHLPGVSSHISHLHRVHVSNFSVGVDIIKHRLDLRNMYDKYAEQLEKLGIERP